MKQRLQSKWVILLAAAMLIILTGCGPQTNSGNAQDTGSSDSTPSATQEENNSKEQVKELKIGLILAETGPASTLGASEVQTAKLIQKKLDAQGPINGNQIKLLIEDYETDDTKAVVAVDRLISEGVIGVVGATQVNTTAAILPKAVAAKLPLLTVAPANAAAGENVFVMTPSNEMVAVQIVDWFKKRNISKVAWVNAKDGFGVDGLPNFLLSAKGTGIEIVAHEEFDATATDMTVQLTKVKKASPEAIVVWSRTPGAGVVARNFKALAFDIPMIQSTAASNQGFLDQVKDNNEGIYVVGSKLSVVEQLPDSEQKTRLKEFYDDYTKEYNTEPDLFAAHTFDALSLLINAVKEGHTIPDDITKYLNGMGEYKGITGTFDFTKWRGTSMEDGLSVLGIENNTWKYIE